MAEAQRSGSQARRLAIDEKAEKARGMAKEAAGYGAGDEELKAEGQAQQRKGESLQEAEEKAKMKIEEARQAERERARQVANYEGRRRYLEGTFNRISLR